MTVHALLVDPEGEHLAERLARSGLALTPVRTAAAARAYLSGSTFDAVAVQQSMDDGLSALATDLGVARVVAYDTADVLEAWLYATFGRGEAAPDTARVPDVAPAARDAALVSLRDEIARVAHDLANPLSVVVGMAQLGREMTADAEAAQAFADIEAAANTLAGRLVDLGALRRRLDGLIG